MPDKRTTRRNVLRQMAGATLALPDEHEERGVYVVEGSLQAGELTLGALQPGVFEPGPVTVRADQKSRVMLLGGAHLPGRRYIWWNFVSSSRERIERAKQDWRDGRFASVPGETEFIPLPER